MSLIREIVNFREQHKRVKTSRVRFYNWCHSWNSFEDIWFYNFIQSRKIVNSKSSKIAFFSVFGSRIHIKIDRSKLKIMFTGENIHREDFSRYENYGYDFGIDLALGFDYIQSDTYLRFPLWILYIIRPEWGYEEIKAFCERISHPQKDHLPDRFCSLVSSHDSNGIRKDIYDKLKAIGPIDCPGRLLNNTNELKDKFNNDKIKYISQHKFNICPENSDDEGYVTEKVFEALVSGTIPIYWGSNNDPEPEVLNKNALILWNSGGDNTSNLELISDLAHNEKSYKEFISLPRLQPDAADHIFMLLNELENKLKNLIK